LVDFTTRSLSAAAKAAFEAATETERENTRLHQLYDDLWMSEGQAWGKGHKKARKEWLAAAAAHQQAHKAYLLAHATLHEWLLKTPCPHRGWYGRGYDAFIKDLSGL
jgi:hypothetical protein